MASWMEVCKGHERMTQAIRDSAQALLDAYAENGPYRHLHIKTARVALQNAMTAPQPAADERVAEHSKLIEKLVHEAWSWGEGCGVDGISSRTQKGDSHNEWGRDRTAEAARAVEQSARALLSASQEDADRINDTQRIEWMFQNCQDTSAEDLQFESPDAWRAWVDAAIRSAMKEKNA